MDCFFLIRLEGRDEKSVFIACLILYQAPCGFVVFLSSQQPVRETVSSAIYRLIEWLTNVQGFCLLKLGIETRSCNSEILAHCRLGPITPLLFLTLWWFRGGVRPFCPPAEWGGGTWPRNTSESHTSVWNIHPCCSKSSSSWAWGCLPLSLITSVLPKPEQSWLPSHGRVPFHPCLPNDSSFSGGHNRARVRGGLSLLRPLENS